MSYDWYCYRGKLDVPDAKEAEAVIEAVNAAEEIGARSAADPAVKERVVAALLEYNPRLERFVPDYKGIAKLRNISEDEARAQMPTIQLNTPEGAKLPFQLDIADEHVFLTIPYWYKGDAADQVFAEILQHLRVIRRTAGYFVYDPQTGAAFDPETTESLNHGQYDEVVEKMPELIAVADKLARKSKPWWKFWG